MEEERYVLLQCVCECVCVCVCVGGGGGGGGEGGSTSQSTPPRGDPWAVVKVWLKLTALTLLELLDIESRVPSDGITQFLPGVFSCRGFAHLSG